MCGFRKNGRERETAPPVEKYLYIAAVINIYPPKKTTLMKNFRKHLFAALALAALTATFASCEKKNCESEKPYYCSTAKSCCAYRYNDGHGTCYSSMDDCRRGGYACEVCHIED